MSKAHMSALCHPLVIREQALVVKEWLPTPVKPKCLLSATCAPRHPHFSPHLGPIGIQLRPRLLLFNSCPATTQNIMAAWHGTT